MNPLAELINTALPNDVKQAIRIAATTPTETTGRRADAMTIFQKLADYLRPLQARWRDHLPGKSPARGVDFPLISALTSKFGYEDTEFIRDLSMGMPIAGPIPPTPGLTARKRDEQMSYQEWKTGIPKRNVEVIDRISKSRGTELAGACWGSICRSYRRVGYRTD